MTPRHVRYDPVFLRRVVLVLSTMAIICAYLGTQASSFPGVKAKVAAVFLITIAALFTPIVLFVLLPRLITKNPVMVITDEWLIIDYLIFEKPMLLPWSGVEAISVIDGQICLLPIDSDRYLRERPFWTRWIYSVDMAHYGTFFRLSPIAFDISSEEFMNLVPAHLRETQEPSPEKNFASMDLNDYLKTLQLSMWVKQDPAIKLETLEDYEREFSRNLVGTWSNDNEMMPNPMSRDIVFKDDGTGYVAGVFFTEYSGKFEWREKSEHLIEVCSIDDSPTWFQVG